MNLLSKTHHHSPSRRIMICHSYFVKIILLRNPTLGVAERRAGTETLCFGGFLGGGWNAASPPGAARKDSLPSCLPQLPRYAIQGTIRCPRQPPDQALSPGKTAL